MHILRPLPPAVTRPIALLVLVAWVATMGTLVARSYGQSSAANLATDLARYGSTAVWRGVYYRGEKIGFTVSQTTRTEEGFELQEDGRLQMALLGATTAARLRTVARVDRSFALRSFSFNLDPGTGAVDVSGRVDGRRLELTITSPSGTRTCHLSAPRRANRSGSSALASASVNWSQMPRLISFSRSSMR